MVGAAECDAHDLRGHPSAVLVPVALAMAEKVNASGLDVLAAYAIGLEVSAKLSPSLGPQHYFRGWHTSATVGIFGATAVAARLLGLDERTAATSCPSGCAISCVPASPPSSWKHFPPSTRA
jgi:2-methylcitrate dehydratase PrpD